MRTNKSMRVRLEKLLRSKTLWGTKKRARRTWAIGGAAIFAFVVAVMMTGIRKAPDPSPAEAGATVRSERAAAGSSANVAPEMPAADAKAPERHSSIVTITGCLERDREAFRLRDTSGADAPKSRSWKSGFLKKGPAAIQIVDASNRVRLPEHVGRRVSVTGVLVDREMQVRSLLRVAATCKAPKA